MKKKIQAQKEPNPVDRSGKPPPGYCWLKIVAYIRPARRVVGPEFSRYVASRVLAFEQRFGPLHLYYAIYVEPNSSRFEISACVQMPQSKRKQTVLRKVADFFMGPEVYRTTVDDRTTGSLAHAYMYQAVKHVPEQVLNVDVANDSAFLDLLHWGCNMHGLDYLREIRLYSYASLRFADMLAKSNDEALAKCIKSSEKTKSKP